MNDNSVSKNYYKLVGIIFGLVALISLLLFYENLQTKDEKTDITIATFSKALGNTPFHVAKVKNMFAENPMLQNVVFHFQEFNDRPSIVQAMEAGQLDVLFSAEIPVILNFAQGLETQIIEVSGVALQEIIVPVSSDINTVRELRGERLAVLSGTSSHYCLVKVLRKNDLELSDLQVSFMSPAEARVEFEAGRLPSWAVWAPWVEQEEVLGYGRPIPDSKASISSVMSVSPSMLTEHEDLVFAIRDVINDSKQWIVDNREEAIEIAATDLNLDIAIVRQAWPKFIWIENLDNSEVADFQDKAQFLADQNLTRNSVLVNVEDILRIGLANADNR